MENVTNCSCLSSDEHTNKKISLYQLSKGKERYLLDVLLKNLTKSNQQYVFSLMKACDEETLLNRIEYVIENTESSEQVSLLIRYLIFLEVFDHHNTIKNIAIENKSIAVRKRAYEYLCKSRKPEYVDFIMKTIDEEDKELSICALENSVFLKDRDIDKLIISALYSQDPQDVLSARVWPDFLAGLCSPFSYIPVAFPRI